MIGNDGPLWGSILNPADQLDVLSVGGWGGHDSIASFSSRGMTTSEISFGGMGRVKPDVLAPSISVHSSGPKKPFECRSLSGTSVATPVVTGFIVAMLSQAFDPIYPSFDDSNFKNNLKNNSQIIDTNLTSSQQIIYKTTNLRGGNTGITYDNYTFVMDEEIFYDRKSPKFVRMKNIAAMKQIINLSARPLPTLGLN